MLHQHALQETSPLLQLPKAATNSIQPGLQPQTQQAEGPPPVPSTRGNSASSSPGVSHLETHAWQARRMAMHRGLWGHALALGAPGRGRGSRSLLHTLRERCIMHDASYWGVIRLSGHQRDVAALLRAVRWVQCKATLS
jgi:hypothetical protein